jgi:hypothetical protein
MRRRINKEVEMLRVRRRFAAASVGAALAIGAVAAPAIAWDCPPPPPPAGKAKCNAGNGNGSESQVDTRHCTNGDPGNSFAAGNRGGDEIPSSDGVPNPGGNNVD